ncbi:hypothetical protein BHE74_00036483 [Ensete ventricosum]|nr:hypothetical protein BHE74_00036483 [Ensete ventricosum]
MGLPRIPRSSDDVASVRPRVVSRPSSAVRSIDTPSLLVVLTEARLASDMRLIWECCDVAERCGRKGGIMFWCCLHHNLGLTRQPIRADVADSRHGSTFMDIVDSPGAMDLNSLHRKPRMPSGKNTSASRAENSQLEVEEIYMETTTKRPARSSAPE